MLFRSSLYQNILSTNLATLGFDFQVPVFLFQGTDDHVTPLTLAEEYYNSIKAPHKELVRIEGGGHFAAWSHATQFHDFKKQGVPESALDAWLAALGWEVLLNKQGTTWRKLPDEVKASVVDAASAKAVLLANSSGIKRPVADWGDGRITVGYYPETWG